MAITLIGHQPIDFTYAENSPCETLSDHCLQYEVGDNPMFQIRNSGSSALLVTIQGVGTDYPERSIPPALMGVSCEFYTYTLNFEELGIESGCFQICVYEIDQPGTNRITNGNFTNDLSGWTVEDALVLDILSFINPTTSGSDDGEVTLIATGGSGIYTYSIDGVTYQASDTFTDLPYGTYTFYVRDSRNVVTTIEFTFRDCLDYAGSEAEDVLDIIAFEVKECEANNFV